MKLLGDLDPAPVVVHNLDGASPYLLVCDHAGRAVPSALGDLGVAPEAFDRHIAWDIGAAALSLRLGEHLDACIIRQTYSRLVIDCNRRPGAVDSIVDYVDGTTIGGNLGLAAPEAQARVDEIHTPYHAAIGRVLDERAKRPTPTQLILVHSFTPQLGWTPRPWHFGVLHQHNSPLSDKVLQRLLQAPEYVIGDNEPYAMDHIDYTAPHHTQGRNIDYCELEVRQDMIADTRGQADIAAFLALLLLSV